MTPYEILYGKAPPTILSYIPKTAKLPAVDAALTSRDLTLQLLKDNLKAAQNRMKLLADKHRTEKTLNVGQWVYLRLQPYRQVSVDGHRPHKLSPLFYGPYQIESRIGPVAYKLLLPSAARIHPVFHVSQLKESLGNRHQLQTTLPTFEVTVIKEPESILDRHTFPKGRRLITEVLIKWQHLPAEEASWENYWELVTRFPSFDHETRSSFQTGRSDAFHHTDNFQPSDDSTAAAHFSYSTIRSIK